ncbi:MAG TPA: LysE family translocator [Solirubrobacteraceae bacterium]|jgi:threonine/homoserine/homoserine lactone efflux protein|nr:LysE family translocator [Solirubrobacteraceae bacterium]
MPGIGRLLLFSATAFVVIVIPGPSVIFLVSRALANGSRGAVLSVLGNAFGEYVQVIGVAFGIGTLVEDSAFVFSALKLIGGAYLIYLGIRTFRQRKSLAAAIGAVSQPRRRAGSFLEAMTVGATNPKTIVFLAAMLPQFVSRGAGSVPLQIMVLGAIFAAIAIISDTVWVLAAGRFRAWFARSPRRLELVGGTGGLAIAAVGAGLLVTGRRS